MELNTDINKAKVVSSLTWKLFERFVSQGLSLAIQIILIRLLLPEDFGSLAIIVAITNYAAIFVQSGIATALIQKKDLDDKDVSTVLISCLILASAFYTILFVAAPFIANAFESDILVPTLRIQSLVLFLNAINSVQTAILSRKMQFKRLFVRSLIAVPVSGIVGIAMAYLGFGLWSLVMYNLSNMLVVVLVMNIGNDLRTKLGFSMEKARTIYSFSSKILVTSFVSGGYDLMRTMAIGKKYNTNDLAFYDKAYSYSYYVVNILNSSISSVMLPTFSKKQDDINEIKLIARRSTKLSAFVMIPLMVGIATIATPLVRLLLTEKWMECVPYLMIFCMLRIPGVFMAIDKQIFYAIGRSEINMYYEICLFIINIIALIISLKMGVLWIAIFACAIEYIGLIAIFTLSKKFVNYNFKERLLDLWKSIVSSIVMFVGLNFINLQTSDLVTILAKFIIGVVVYLLMSMILSDDSLKYIFSIVKRK
ncbi:lipopolysaccharide biosynthesis protein [Bacteroides thetaiotaomicron]|nr:lipopolysaccharide biosynthesis protein [Bacteroides thetaiotaomicron]